MEKLTLIDKLRTRKSSSIKQVAQLAGASISTVSRVFNNNTSVNREISERIREISRQLNYSPDSRGRSLRSGKHWNIGVMVAVSDYCDFQFNERMISYLVRWVTNYSYGVSLEFIDGSQKTKLEDPVLLTSNKVDGLIIIGHLDQRKLEKLAQWGMPVCLIENRFESPRFSSVNLLNKEGSILAISYLVSLGHKHIGYTHSTFDFPSIRERFIGYKEGLAANGISFNTDYVFQVDEKQHDYRGGYRATHELLKKSPEITAILYLNDWYAVGGLAAVQAMGRKVPEDISLVGYDDHWMASELEPLLTTVSTEMDELCRCSVELLLREIESNSHTHANVAVWPKLVIRESCAKVSR